ncbi:c-type cytochrome [Occallatibacter riparius]|uniref:Photosynthetic reaction center cytochrome c subunit n=1 Tax=Occallatibacter riparius TaxID=1002689 RepID=A0A9J7BV48_9BACT|nr:c-type cytochrome [Occallatibacter riparius]UWZ86543.1 c-type cytochrome [Occallatibacter riparius]
MKRFLSPLSAAAAVLLTAAIVAASVAAQSPQPQPAGAAAQPQQGGPLPGGPSGPPHEMPAPKNLKVLPKNLTGNQVHDIMEGWAGSLGVHCDNCHSVDPGKVGPNGRPRLNFADDSKPEKNTARLMYTMTQKINDDTMSMVNDGQSKVTCGTCHRGHKKPEAYVPPKEHDGPHPPAPGEKPPIPR